MDTKSKNEPDKPAIARALLVCLAGLALLFAVDIGKKRDYIYDNPFLNGDTFYDVHVLLNVRDIVRYNVEYRNYNKVSETVIRQWRDEFNAYAGAVMLRTENPSFTLPTPSFVLSASTDSAVRAMRERTEHWLTDEWNKQVEAVWNAQLYETIKQYVSEREAEQQNLKRKMDRIDPIIKYTIYDRRNHETYSNRAGNPNEVPTSELFTDIARTMTFPLKEPIKQLNSLNDYFKQNQLEGTFTFYANVEPADPAFATEMVMAKDYIRLLSIRERLQYEIFGLAVTLASMALLLLYLYKNKASDKGLETITARWQRIPIDIRLALPFLVIFIAVEFGKEMYGWGMQTPFGPLNKWFLLTALVAYARISLSDAYYLYRTQGAFSEQWRKGYALTLGKLGAASMVNISMLVKSVLLFAATVLLGPAIVLITNESGTLSVLGIVYTVSFLLLLLPYLFQRLRMFNMMLSGASEIAAGQLNVTFEERGNGQMARMMRQLNNMKLGYQAALERQLRSERQKSELISNVSHDLKTPLTSMINFVDLLKKENLPQHDLNRYVQVLDRKTQRLKVLIDDLFEVSQLTGGAVRPVLEPVNASALLQQALAEFADKIDASGLQFRVHIGNPLMTARLDGKKTWRVFENLIGNALNYSMPNTRVHVSLTEENEYIVLRINNVSAYEINCEAEELFERSKRGDASRHTEGSGLGLAIARSIVELQGGRMFIEIDGDYFKVTVMLIK